MSQISSEDLRVPLQIEEGELGQISKAKLSDLGVISEVEGDEVGKVS